MFEHTTQTIIGKNGVASIHSPPPCGIVLASGSPRRCELLKMIGLEFEVVPAETEREIDANLPIDRAVIDVALGKGREVSEKVGSDVLVLSADTVVVCDDEVFGKPKDADDAFEMLRKLSGRTHQVYTGVALLRSGSEDTFCERTDVTFRAMTVSEISDYIATGEPMDKAGAYAVQGIGAVFVERINGDFFNVVGLPLCKLYAALRNKELCK